MKQGSKRLISLAIALFFMIAALIILFELIQPEYSNVLDAKAQILGEQMSMAAETKAVAQAQALLNTYNAQGEAEQNISLAMPPGEDQAGALAQIYGIAQNNGLTIGTIGVSAPTIQVPAAAAAPTGAAASPQSLTKPVGAISFQITASGSYEDLKGFLSGLETNVRIFDLKNISVAQASGGAKDFFNYTIAVTSYYQKP